jgi:hypothetical protein
MWLLEAVATGRSRRGELDPELRAESELHANRIVMAELRACELADVHPTTGSYVRDRQRDAWCN